MPREKPVVVSLCGPAGSGKSTLAKAVVTRLGTDAACRIPGDYFILPVRLDQVENRPSAYQYDWPLIAESFQQPMGTTVWTSEFDFVTFQRIPGADSRPLVVRPVMIVDVMHPFPAADILIAVNVPAETRLERIEHRDKVWKSRVAARWQSLEAARAWLEQSGVTPDLRLNGETLAETNAALVVSLIERSLGTNQQR